MKDIDDKVIDCIIRILWRLDNPKDADALTAKLRSQAESIKDLPEVAKDAELIERILERMWG